MDHVLVRILGRSGCGMSFGTVRIIDLDFTDDPVTTVVFSNALESISEEGAPLGLRVS